jgi:hypothetical protein
MPRRRDRAKKRTKIIWWLFGFLAASYLLTLLLRTPVPAVVCCVAFVMPLAGRMDTRKGAGWLGFGLGLVGGLASLWAMMTLQSTVPLPPSTTTQPASTQPATQPEPTTAPAEPNQGTTTQPADTQPHFHYERRRIPPRELAVLALVTVGTTVPFSILIALLYHRLAQRRKKRIDDEWRVFRDEDT